MNEQSPNDLLAETSTVRKHWRRTCRFGFGQSHLVSGAVVPVIVFFILSSCAQAQYTGNFQTNVINGPNPFAGNYVVGSNWVYDALVIQNSGSLSDGVGYIGYTASANYNAAIVAGSGSVWSNSSDLYVGYSGVGNRLTVTNAGALYNNSGYVGYT